ncbi:MAG: hypothetical protein FWG89_03315 [Treponema sp.]|nr:hypothetical protein [Treponema sp.]
METEKHDGKQERIPWHPAFVEALQMELEAYRDILEFIPECQLTSEPLRIDCVVIKKAKNVVIKKNIAAIFREANLLEYKSPSDYISVADFYKVYGYACLYASLKKNPVTGLTVSFVQSRYPAKLLKHLKEVRGYKVEKTGPGIYTVSGDILPIQIIDNRKLLAKDNIWLKSLYNRLDLNVFRQISAEAASKDKDARIQAYLNAVYMTNSRVIQEEIQMGKAKLTLAKVLEDAGMTAEWEARGEERKAFDIARNLLNLGFPPETVVSATGLDLDKVQSLEQFSAVSAG